MGSTGLLGASAACLRGATNEPGRKLDRYGGLASPRLEPSGFFRVEKTDRWWFVTPSGGPFLSFGLNHPNEDYLQQEYNVDFWKAEFGVQDASGPGFRKAFIRKVMKDLSVFGMNTIGCHAPKHEFGKITVPYLQALFFVRTAYWLVRSPRDFPDVFSSAFEQRCERVAQRVVSPRKDDPYLIGYTFTNVPILTDLDADAHGQVPWGRAQPNMPTWPRALRNLNGEAPGKQVYVSLIRNRHPSIEDFNQRYQSAFTSFDELLAAENWSPFERVAAIDDAEDNRAFLLRILERYYRVARDAVRRLERII